MNKTTKWLYVNIIWCIVIFLIGWYAYIKDLYILICILLPLLLEMLFFLMLIKSYIEGDE